MLFKDVYEDWLVKSYGNVKESTTLKTKQQFKNHILPAIGDKNIKKITKKDCEVAARVWDSKMKRSDNTIGYALKVFNYALHNGIISKNPMHGVTAGKVIEYTRTLRDASDYSKEEIEQLSNQIRTEADLGLRVALTLLNESGVTPSELCALNWEDWILEDRTIMVNKSVIRKENGLSIQKLDDFAIREVIISGKTTELLEVFRKMSKSRTLIANARGGILDPNTLKVKFKKFLKKNALKDVKLKELRTFALYKMLELGVELADINSTFGFGEDYRTLQKYLEKFREVYQQQLK